MPLGNRAKRRRAQPAVKRHPRGPQLHLVLDHLHDPVLDHWMADSHKRLSGRLVVTGIDGSRFRTVQFHDALCVSEGLYFNATGVGPATTMSVLISANRLVVDGVVETSNHWPDAE